MLLPNMLLLTIFLFLCKMVSNLSLLKLLGNCSLRPLSNSWVLLLLKILYCSPNILSLTPLLFCDMLLPADDETRGVLGVSWGLPRRHQALGYQRLLLLCLYLRNRFHLFICRSNPNFSSILLLTMLLFRGILSVL